MDRRHALKALAGIALCPICRPAFAEGAHWSYEGATGPAKWGDLDAADKACAVGSQQSPINVDIDKAIRARLPAVKLDWAKSADTIINNGHTIQLNFAEGSTLTLGDVKYQLVQVHFHRPSEHTIAGKSFPMEAHFVHRADSGALAVIGVLMAEGQQNEAFGRIVKTMPATEGPAVKADPKINPNALLPKNLGYCRYSGSLTTPPCSEIVEWVLLTAPIHVAAADVEAFAKLYPMNARPVQKDNRRFVLRSS